MTPEEKLLEAARRAGPKLPAGVRHEFEALFAAENLAVTAGVLGVWAASHAFGIGFAIDLLLLLGGLVAMGTLAVQAVEKLRLFVTGATKASSEAELERAAAELAAAVTMVGVTVFTTLVLKRIGKSAASNRAVRAARLARRQRIVQALGVKAQNPFVRGRVAKALDFYERKFVEGRRQRGLAEWSEQDLVDHLKGIDYSEEVECVRLAKGTRLVGFKQAGEKDLSGNYFARPGASPRSLAISEHGADYQKVMRGGAVRQQGRRHVVYEVERETQALRAKVASNRDTWSHGRTTSFPQTDLHRPPGGTRALEKRGELVFGGGEQLVLEDAGVLRVIPKPEGAGGR